MQTQIDNTENNILIAEFLGGIIDDNFIYFYKTGNRFEDDTLRTTDLLFETDWNWLMSAVEKIEEVIHPLGRDTHNFRVLIEANGCYITSRIENDWKDIYSTSYLFLDGQHTISKIKAVYSSVIEFIKWYNLQNK